MRKTTTPPGLRIPAWLSPGSSIRGLYVLMGTEVAAFIPFFSLVLRHRGLRPDRIGIVLAAMSISGLLASTLLGHAADVVLGLLTALRATAFLAAGMAALLNVAGSEMALLSAAIGLSVCWAPIVPMSDAITLQHLGTGRRQTYGQIRLWMSMGFSLAALAFGGLYTWVGLESMPSTFGIALLVLGLWTMIADLPSSSAMRDRSGPETGGLRVLWRSTPRLFAILLAALLVTTGVNAILTFVPLRIGGLGGTPLLVGLAVALAAAVEVPVMAFSARLIRRIGLRGCFVLAALQYAGAFLALSILSSPVAITVVVASGGTGFALLYVSLVIAVDSLVLPSLRATGQGVRQTVTLGLAPILGTAGGGLLYTGVGPSALFFAASMLAAAGGLIGWKVLSTPVLSRGAVAADPLDVAGYGAEGEIPPLQKREDSSAAIFLGGVARVHENARVTTVTVRIPR
jgi:PPP family 3-phenylpropionic acid transporter